MAEPVLALDDAAARERVPRVEGLLEELEGAGAAVPRDSALELVQALLDLYGDGLRRFVAAVAERDDDGAIAAAVARDELVSHLLLLHGLHPVALEARVRGALDEVRPYLESHGGDVELLAVDDGVVRLALEGSCNGCPSSAVTLKLAIEDAIWKAAPDVERIDAEGAADPTPAAAPLLQIELSDALKAPAAEPPGEWAAADGLPALVDGGVRLHAVAGQRVLFLAAGGRTYAYRPDCPACGVSLEEARLVGGELHCGGCEARYDVRRAGRGVDAPDLHLAPIPLLDDGGAVRVALGAAA
jgi:Fe-S cluster biogenesis protein NfuA/nitrite reductase/ring-hydroxylating ferredoxin subunit